MPVPPDPSTFVGVPAESVHAEYALCPGYVTSKTDGDVHFIKAPILADLYKVPLSKCVVKPHNLSIWEEIQWEAKYGHLIKLRPRYYGDYTLLNQSEE